MDHNATKRKMIVTSTMIGFPMYYMLKHRNDIYRGSKIVKEFYIKEIVARSFIGLIFGFVVGIYFYGFSETPAETSDKESLEYSAKEKKKFQRRVDYLPDKIRNE